MRAIRVSLVTAEMDNPHRRVHEHAIVALEAHHNGNAELTVKAVAAMESASHEVLAALELIARSGAENADMLCSHN